VRRVYSWVERLGYLGELVGVRDVELAPLEALGQFVGLFAHLLHFLDRVDGTGFDFLFWFVLHWLCVPEFVRLTKLFLVFCSFFFP
jgi:hypothetical protein